MDVYQINSMSGTAKYAGRGIVTGLSENGKYAVCAYFIMGRSANSRNRVFTRRDNGDIYTAPADDSKVEDPSLIIYAAIRKFENKLIVTNGDQTDTIYNTLACGGTFEGALETRKFEPDEPNFTPRISSMLDFENGFSYKMSILKSADPTGGGCNRFTFSYSPCAGVGHFIHTYMDDGNPLPTFTGEPERVHIPDDIDSLTNEIWDNLDNDNKISLYVRYTDLENGKISEKLINKYERIQ